MQDASNGWLHSNCFWTPEPTKILGPLGGAIFDENDQYWYETNELMILQRLVGIASNTGSTSDLGPRPFFDILHLFEKSL